MACRTSERNEQIKAYYKKLRLDGYSAKKARELTRNNFRESNLSVRRVKDIVGKR